MIETLFFVACLLPVVTLARIGFLVRKRPLEMRVKSRLQRSSPNSRTNTIIYGAGATGSNLANALKNDFSLKLLGFVDDDPALHGLKIHGLSTIAPRELPEFSKKYKVKKVVLAMPSITDQKRQEIGSKLAEIGLSVVSIPSLGEMIRSSEAVKPTHLVVDNLLGRDRRSFENNAFRGLNFLITGAGGPLAMELGRQAISAGAKKLVMFEEDDIALMSASRHFHETNVAHSIEVVEKLGSLTDISALERVLRENEIDVVIHTASYTSVPALELNVLAAVHRNIFGSINLAKACDEVGVKKLLHVSSDKAVRPTSILGAAARVVEMYLQGMAAKGADTVFSSVRMGNILGSAGSVVSLFEKQISEGGPVTVTHPDVARHFLTVTEAASLSLEAVSFARGGDVFALDMGVPVPIMTIAKKMIEARGYTVRDENNPNGNIPIEITGLRPGEKLHEELQIGADMLTTPNPKILRALDPTLSEFEIVRLVKGLETALENVDEGAARELLFASGPPLDGQRRSGTRFNQ